MSSQTTIESLRPIVQTYSVLAITLAAGTNLSTSIVTLPALLQSSSATLASQWKTLFDRAIGPVVSLSMSSAVGFAALAYHSMLTPTVTTSGALSYRARNLYAAASVGAFGLAPYTQFLMGSINAELSRRGSASQEKAGTHELVRTWGRYNLVRGCMLLFSAGLGMWACLSK
ncbi:hypothetical protein OPT61_g9931 [Boeremia exigua]|uniref:Uncharacterized protein n=1 Tax=Boeremia exigua TaxID=749465 RepID=A0ACC2HSJ6_9PLEO|nr:hypothetical protein OPT61_g9931 [Boeremia exigua]